MAAPTSNVGSRIMRYFQLRVSHGNNDVTIIELCDKLALTPETARRHTRRLEAIGMLSKQGKGEGLGARTQLFSITDKGLASFDAPAKDVNKAPPARFIPSSAPYVPPTWEPARAGASDFLEIASKGV